MVSVIQLADRHLQDLRVGLFQPFRFRGLLQGREHLDQVRLAQVKPVLEKGVLFYGQEVVVNEPGVTELDRQGRLLFPVRVDAEPVGFSDLIATATGNFALRQAISQPFSDHEDLPAGAPAFERPAAG